MAIGGQLYFERFCGRHGRRYTALRKNEQAERRSIPPVADFLLFFLSYFCAAESRSERILSWAVFTSADCRVTISLIGAGKSFSIASL